jgi:RNA 3'-terminal phosphate cyclase (ATP)
MMLADAPSKLRLEGGTHNPLAPPFEFISETFLPLINRIGPKISTRLERPGFAPRGGGLMHATIQPAKKLAPLIIRERGEILQQEAEVQLAHLPAHIAAREIDVISSALHLSATRPVYKNITAAYGPGNVALVRVRSEAITEVFSAFGIRGLPAEKVAQQLVNEVSEYLESNVPVGKHLADQLLLPLALAGRGAFLTQTPSTHTLTNIGVINDFMDVQFNLDAIRPGAWLISLE